MNLTSSYLSGFDIESWEIDVLEKIILTKATMIGVQKDKRNVGLPIKKRIRGFSD